MYIVHQEVKQLNATESLVGVITYDECASNPVEHWDLLGTMAVHPNHSHWAHEAVDLDIPMGNNPIEHMHNFIKAKGYKQNEVIAYPITKYEHSGISLSLGDNRICPFDSGIIGFIYASKEKIRKEFKVQRITKDIVEKVAEIFANELETQSTYLNGEVFEQRIYRVNTEEFEKHGKYHLATTRPIERCSGFYGEEYAIDSLHEVLECMAKNVA